MVMHRDGVHERVWVARGHRPALREVTARPRGQRVATGGGRFGGEAANHVVDHAVDDQVRAIVRARVRDRERVRDVLSNCGAGWTRLVDSHTRLEQVRRVAVGIGGRPSGVVVRNGNGIHERVRVARLHGAARREGALRARSKCAATGRRRYCGQRPEHVVDDASKRQRNVAGVSDGERVVRHVANFGDRVAGLIDFNGRIRRYDGARLDASILVGRAAVIEIERTHVPRCSADLTRAIRVARSIPELRIGEMAGPH